MSSSPSHASGDGADKFAMDMNMELGDDYFKQKEEQKV